MDQFKLNVRPLARTNAMVVAGNARFSILTTSLIRCEYSDSGVFEDRASQVFWYRDQPVPNYETKEVNGFLEIVTDKLTLIYQIGEVFSADTLKIKVHESEIQWAYGVEDQANLLGTARTLDNVSGSTQLEKGLLSRTGWTIIDDSNTLLFDDSDWLIPAENRNNAVDVYFFGYGLDYQRALTDYFTIAGKIPLIPRWILGNWWSRYWAYTQDELAELMHEFRRQEIPLSVCIVDMDWHTTDGANPRGWTGYTWNRKLFPDPKGFIDFLHSEGLRTALNLHPSDGVYPHEEQYSAFAEHMNQQDGRPIRFAIENKRFTEAYFELLHHPHEDIGIDFWWMDWQQGTQSGLSGLDPLWWLNHLHFYDLKRNGDKRPFVFSRWGGLGNHRYPIGFSGDTIVDWESLSYQPYFTATASNVGYGWWSHDIGGHAGGIEDPELYARWVQFGVFSPIFRLHSTKNMFHVREPWKYDLHVRNIAKEFMQFRHALIPYLYSMAKRASEKGKQLILPMYHEYPEDEPAYHVHNQYIFGSELLVAPVCTPADSDIGLARQIVWLPPDDGGWYGFFDGLSFESDAIHVLFNKLAECPVFAKAGAIIPLSEQLGWGGIENPGTLNIHIFPCADGHFDLYEDDGLPISKSYSTLKFMSSWSISEWRLHIKPEYSDTSHLPESRNYVFNFRSIVEPDAFIVRVNGQDLPFEQTYDADLHTFRIELSSISNLSELEVILTGQTLKYVSETRRIFAEKLIWSLRLETWVKRDLWNLLPELLADISTFDRVTALLNSSQKRALLEVLMSAGMEHITNIGEGRQPVLLWNNLQHPQIEVRRTSWRGWQGSTTETNTVKQFEVSTAHSEQKRQIIELSYGTWLNLRVDL